MSYRRNDVHHTQGRKLPPPIWFASKLFTNCTPVVFITYVLVLPIDGAGYIPRLAAGRLTVTAVDYLRTRLAASHARVFLRNCCCSVLVSVPLLSLFTVNTCHEEFCLRNVLSTTVSHFERARSGEWKNKLNKIKSGFSIRSRFSNLSTVVNPRKLVWWRKLQRVRRVFIVRDGLDRFTYPLTGKLKSYYGFDLIV